MMRIGATIGGIEQFLLNHLASLDAAATANAIRLATGKQVNKPSDDPSAFLEISRLESRKTVIDSTLDKVASAANVGAQAQLTVDQIRTQLERIREALVADEQQTLAPDERAASQAEIDAAIAEINRLSGTEIEGVRLFSGAADFLATGVDRTQVRSLEVVAAPDGATISGTVSSAATQAELQYSGPGGVIQNDAVVTITGARGGATFTFAQNDPLSDAADQINQLSHQTGVLASVAGNTLTLTSVDYGQDATIAVDVVSGSFNVTGGNGDGTAQGTDAVVTINGVTLGDAQVDGNRAVFSRNGLHVALEFAEGFSGAFGSITISDDHVLKFGLSEDPNDAVTLALPSLHSARLGGVSGSVYELASGQALSGLGSNTPQAIRVIDEALSQLTRVEGRVDAFADVAVASSKTLLEGFKTAVDDALEAINGVNEDEESVLLAKNQALATNTVSALSILEQQRFLLLDLVRQMSGIY